jgi:hypothetical protein
MAYERLVANDEDNGSADTVVDAQGRAHKRRLVREKLERLGWIVASIALVGFGNGSTNLVTAVFHRAKAARLWFLLTALSMVGRWQALTPPRLTPGCPQVVRAWFRQRLMRRYNT